MIFVVCGNIGSGKSTLLAEIKRRSGDNDDGSRTLVIEEPIGEWAYFLKRMYDTKFDGRALFMFQSLVFSHYMRVTAMLTEIQADDPERIVFIERCPAEALNVFLPLNKDKFSAADYAALTHMHQQLVEDPVWAKHATYIVLRAPPDVCKERIDSRSRAGETNDGIPLDYLCRIDALHDEQFLRLLPKGRVSVFDNGRDILPTTLYTDVGSEISRCIMEISNESKK
jgi:deoxyadenosine/deoxycytidine kinase